MLIFWVAKNTRVNFLCDGRFVSLDMVSSLSLQLFSIATAGGCSGVEDQTDLLGVETQRSKSIKRILLTRWIHFQCYPRPVFDDAFPAFK